MPNTKAAFSVLLLLVFFSSSFAVSNEVVSTSTQEVAAASTREVTVASINFWQECDITFWQTAPFAVFWTGLLDTQLSSYLGIVGATHWEIVLPVAIVISAGNAYLHASKDISQSENSR